MKKPKNQKRQMIDDIEELPEELEEDIYEHEGVEYPGDVELDEDTTEELTEDDFHRFKKSLPSDWEG